MAASALEDPKKHIDAAMVSEILYGPGGKEIYVSTVTMGIFRSSDGGKIWTPANQGIADPLIYQMAMIPQKERDLYAASWGGGVYRTGDGGATWREMNRGLTTTAVAALSIDSSRPDTLAAVTSQGVYRSGTGGEQWSRWNEGLDDEKEIFYNAIQYLSGKPSLILLGTDRGVWQRRENDPQWTLSGVKGLDVRVLKFDPASSQLFAGTSYGGLFVGRFNPGTGKVLWTEASPDFRKFFVQSLLIVQEGKQRVIYIGTSDSGVLRSADGGKTYRVMNRGIEKEEVKALARNPAHEKELLAGTRDNGVFRSRDSGGSWEPVRLPLMPLADVLDFTAKSAAARVKGRPLQPPPPEGFQRCNSCHGWADPVLHLHPQTYWRVSPSPRDWRHTVERMARGDGWRESDKKAVMRYMNRYYGLKSQGE